MLNQNTVIVDNGSYELRAGFNIDDNPQIVLPSILGYNDFNSYNRKAEYICDETKNTNSLRLKSPFYNGIINNWQEMEKIWDYAFLHLGIDPSEYNILITDHPSNSTKISRGRMIEIMFEKYKFLSFYSGFQEVLSFFGTGKTTGLSFNLGENLSFAVPIYDGYVVKPSIKEFHITGNVLTSWLQKLLMKNNDHFNPYTYYYIFNHTSPSNVSQIIDDIKKKHTFVSLDYESDILKSSIYRKKIIFNDGSDETISEERFSCPELLFQPKGEYIEFDPIHKTIYESISQSDLDLQNVLFKNIYLSGGSTKMPNLSKRLTAEISKLTSKKQEINVNMSSEKHDVWKGASMFASLEQFSTFFISKEDYNENGISIINNLIYEHNCTE